MLVNLTTQRFAVRGTRSETDAVEVPNDAAHMKAGTADVVAADATDVLSTDLVASGSLVSMVERSQQKQLHPGSNDAVSCTPLEGDVMVHL